MTDSTWGDTDADDDELFGSEDPPAVPAVPDVDSHTQMLRDLNALPNDQFLIVSDAAIDRAPVPGETPPSELRELIELIRTTGFPSGAPSPAAVAPEARTPVDFLKLSDSDYSRVADAVLSGSELPENDPMAPLVAEQLAARALYEGGDA